MTTAQSDMAIAKPMATAIDFVTGKGLQPRNLDELWRLASRAAASGLVPKGVDTPEKCFIAMQLGAELGLSPMQSVQGIAVINGRPSVWGDTLLAICQRASVFDHEAFEELLEGEGDNREAVCRCKRVGGKRVTERRFSVADAKKAGLWGKAGPWQQYADRMLQMRARGFALRDTFADLLRGYYTAEEAEDMPPREVAVTVSTPKPAGPTSRAAALSASLAAPAGPPAEVQAQVDALRAEVAGNGPAVAQDDSDPTEGQSDAPDAVAQAAGAGNGPSGEPSWPMGADSIPFDRAEVVRRIVAAAKTMGPNKRRKDIGERFGVGNWTESGMMALSDLAVAELAEALR